MKSENTARKIECRIKGFDNQTIFTVSDLLDISSYDAAKQMLSRMAKDKKLTRIIRGFYKKAEFNEFIQQEIRASGDELAHALAREYRWTIVPKGEAALNKLGLSTQVPVSLEFASSGPTRTIKYGRQSIKFIHRTKLDSKNRSEKELLVIEAIQTLGRMKVDDNSRYMLARKLTKMDIENIQSNNQWNMRWIREEIDRMIKVVNHVELGAKI